jgi:hypothetical protein
MQNSIPLSGCTSSFIHSPSERHFAHFQFGTVVDKTAVSIHLHPLCGHEVLTPRSVITGPCGKKSSLVFVSCKVANSTLWSSYCSTASPAFSILFGERGEEGGRGGLNI